MSICRSYKNRNKHKTSKIKNRLDYLFNDNMIVNIKDFDSSLLEKKTNYHSRLFLVLIFTTLNTSLHKVLIV